MEVSLIFITRPLPHPARKNACQAILDAPDGWIIKIEEPKRTLAQNALMWVMLQEVSKQVDWYGQHLTDGEWKDVFTAALKRQKVVPGLDGGFVVCGQHTSSMSIGEITEMIELMRAFGADPKHPVNFRRV